MTKNILKKQLTQLKQRVLRFISKKTLLWAILTSAMVSQHSYAQCEPISCNFVKVTSEKVFEGEVCYGYVQIQIYNVYQVYECYKSFQGQILVIEKIKDPGTSNFLPHYPRYDSKSQPANYTTQLFDNYLKSTPSFMDCLENIMKQYAPGAADAANKSIRIDQPCLSYAYVTYPNGCAPRTTRTVTDGGVTKTIDLTFPTASLPGWNIPSLPTLPSMFTVECDSKICCEVECDETGCWIANSTGSCTDAKMKTNQIPPLSLVCNGVNINVIPTIASNSKCGYSCTAMGYRSSKMAKANVPFIPLSKNSEQVNAIIADEYIEIYNADKVTEMMVYDLQGKKITEGIKNINQNKIDMSIFGKGNYILYLEMGKGNVKTIKFQKP